MKRGSKVVVIGAGSVGSASAYSLLLSGIAREIVIIDVNKEKAWGESMDLKHAMGFSQPTEILSGDYSLAKGADVIVITAGAKQKKGQTRLDLLQTNKKIFEEIIYQLSPYIEEKTIMLIVSNPVDVMTYVTMQLMPLPKSQIIGSGTVLDSSRLRCLIAQYCHIDPRCIHAYIVGEHGDSEICAWSSSYIGGLNVRDYLVHHSNNSPKEFLDDLQNQVRDAAYQIIQAKGATSYGIASAVTKIVQAILSDEAAVLPVSTYIEEFEGIRDFCFSMPSVVTKNGIRGRLDLPLSEEEKEHLLLSAKTIREAIDSLHE